VNRITVTKFTDNRCLPSGIISRVENLKFEGSALSLGMLKCFMCATQIIAETKQFSIASCCIDERFVIHQHHTTDLVP